MKWVLWPLLAGLIIGGASLRKASADPVDWSAATYAAKASDAVCTTLDTYPTDAGVMGVMQGIEEDGFTVHQAAQIVVIAVSGTCPRNMVVLQRFINGGTGVNA